MDSPNIYQRINAVMGDCDYLKKEKAQQGKGIRYDDVIAMLRPLLIKHGVVVVVRQLSLESIGGVEGTKQKIYQGAFEMDLVNVDKPEEKVTHTASAHGMDGGDKAPGKAHTYAVKLMLVKGFCIETGEDEESRSEKLDIDMITTEQQQEMRGYFEANKHLWPKISAAYKINGLSDIKKSKFNEIKKLVSGNASN